MKSLRSQTIWCTDNEHVAILHHLEQHFVTVACEQVQCLKLQSTSYCPNISLCSKQHGSLRGKHFIQGKGTYIHV
jgi:hypothetical protein